MSSYNYDIATKRNIGILTRDEQNLIGELRVAIPGVGGLGGTQVMILARLGVKNFSIAEFDSYDFSNFNRQYGASVETVGKYKIDVMSNHIKSVSPDCNIKQFREGLQLSNVHDFVSSADIIMDAIDLTAMDIREALYAEARNQNKFVIACGPIGYGFFCLIFDPKGATYPDAFGDTKQMSSLEKMHNFLVKLTPDSIHANYMEKSLITPEFEEDGGAKFSWISPAIFLAAGNGVAELLKIVLKKGNIITVPQCYQYDVHENQLKVGTIK